MRLRRILRPAAAGAILFLSLGSAPAQHSGLTALNTIERGQWQLKQADGSARKLCLTAPVALIQLRHAGQQCTQTVLDNSRDAATVRYECPGHGYGQTTVSVETARLIRVETSGIVDGMPFQDEYEGRKLGPCG
ncbi:hypothetical protein OF829_16865 [Sphingomonas sp. LB-2]|uniref:DUF3617 domain-containing protein n=1 Tax=Sphingomonas caeni TaxID=2984949 RepID=UPI002230D2F5|nr:hypothetical protein [Sphingomonas caeni]MCW3848911.1 hypothetical protein [Sphingomonas caeni]